MSAALKVTILLASYAIIWLKIQLSYKKPWSDKRTGLHRAVLALVKYVLVPTAVFASLVAAILDDSRHPDIATPANVRFG